MARLVLRAARLLDGRGSAPVSDAALVCDEGKIVYAGPADGAPAPARDDIRVEAKDGTLIPGLIDCHVHLCFDGVADFAGEARAMTPASAALKAARNARRALEAGITTVRDLGGIELVMLEVARAQREGVISGSRIFSAPAVLTVTGGHGHFIGWEVDSAEELVKAVRRLVKAGAGWIKIMSTGGVLTPGIGAQRSAYTVEQLEAAINEAHEAGIRVATHAIGAEGIVRALRAGVDSVEHGCYLSDDALKLLAENGSWLVATLVAPERILHGGEGVPDYAIRKSEEVAAVHRDSFRKAVDAGVRIAAGTDAGTPFNTHGGLWRELALMHSAGMPLERVLIAATSEAAALLNIQAGALEPGLLADAVVLAGDPLTDPAAYRAVSVVVQDGAVVFDAR
ncbi:MAG: amidohydrolase family protein [Actinomycetota bacterium]